MKHNVIIIPSNYGSNDMRHIYITSESRMILPVVILLMTILTHSIITRIDNLRRRRASVMIIWMHWNGTTPFNIPFNIICGMTRIAVFTMMMMTRKTRTVHWIYLLYHYQRHRPNRNEIIIIILGS